METNYWQSIGNTIKSKTFIALVLALAASLTLRVNAAPRPPGPPFPGNGIIYSESFDEPYQLPAGQIDPNVFIESWSGYALNRPTGTTVTPWIVPMVGAGGSHQLAPNSGAVRVWYAPSFSGASSGGDGPANPVALMTLISTNASSISTWWTLSVTADGNQVQLECATGNGPALCLTGQVALQQGVWTLLTFCYSETNSAIFANDQQIASGSGLPVVPAAVAPFTGLVIGSSLDGQPAMGAFEEFAACRRTTFPRGHCNPWGLDPAWDIGIYYSDYAPIAAFGPIGSATGASLVSRPAMLSAASAMTLMDSSNTNSFPPTSTNGLTLVSPPPKVGAFFSLQNGAPIPCGVFTNLNYWAVGDPTNGVFIIDDSQIDLSSYASQQLDVTPQDRTPPDTNGFYLSISGPPANGVVNGILHGTTNGASYTLLSCEKLSLNPSGLFAVTNQNWLVEQDIIGATGQNWTPFQVPTFGRTNLFLWAHQGPDSRARFLIIQLLGVNMTAGQVNLKLYSTAANQTYDIVSKQNLTDEVWTSEGTFLGQTNWTAVTVSIGARTTSLFLRARQWVDSTGSGIPDWWLMQYFPANWNTIDPFAQCPCGDGWTILQAWQNGWNPLQWHTPPAPQGVTVAYNSASGLVNVNWQSSPGPVTGYTLQRSLWGTSPTNFILSASANSFQETLAESASLPCFEGPTMYAHYSAQAHYSGGDSAWSGNVPLEPDGLFFATLVSGPGGQPALAFANLPPHARILRLTRDDIVAQCNFDDSSLNAQWEVPTSALNNGLYLLPTNAIPADRYGADVYSWWVQTKDANNGLSAAMWVSTAYNPDTNAAWIAVPFIDGRRQMKQNLNFMLRVPNATQPFGYYALDPTGFITADHNDYPTSYAYAGLYHFDYDTWGVESPSPDPLRPFEENYLYRNFVFSTDNLNTDGTLTGLGWTCCPDAASLQYPVAYEFHPPSTSAPIPSVLDTNTQRWTCFYPQSSAGFGGGLDSINVTAVGLGGGWPSPTTFYMTNTQPNYFGLPFLSAHFAYNTNNALQFTTLYAGGSIPAVSGGVFAEAATPVLQTVDYYFARPWIDPVPGLVQFSPTNTTAQPMIVGFASSYPAIYNEPSFKLAGYAKQILLNGYSNVFGYLGQYFDQALVIDASGTVTTNRAGFLSPYGDFLPTVPGPAALVTMPDIDTGQRGTGIVSVIKLQLDVNHDGIMDQSYIGPDNTTWGKPFVFWVNNDYDGIGIGQDNDITGLSNAVDYTFGTIHSQRNLEDFARLWICGVPSLPENSGYQVTLSWATVTSGSPAINLYKSCETNGGTSYLTDTSLAAAQIANSGGNQPYSSLAGPGVAIARLGTSTTFSLPVNAFTSGQNKYFLFEGAGIGAGQLMLTIAQVTSQGTNVLTQTSVWLDLRDVKDMYERVHITGATNSVPPAGFLSSSYQQLNAVPSSSDEDTNIIVFVHGWRMGAWDYLNFSETMLKRLYWQGFHGRFVSIRWDTLSKDDFRFFGTLNAFGTYNPSEYRAWESAKGLSGYLTYLKQQRFPNYNLNICSHSMGGVVMAETLKLQLAASQRNVNNYVLMQVAVPASCYDASFTNYAPFLSAEATQPTPNTYWVYPGSIGGAVSGHLVDFYNVNDYALATGTVGGFPVSWEANQKSYKPDYPFGYSTDGTNCSKYNGLQGVTSPVTDSHEIMSFCARPRSKAVGAQPNVGGVIFSTGQVDLTASFNFQNRWDQHSAEFNWNIQQLGGFYHMLLNTLIPPGQ